MKYFMTCLLLISINLYCKGNAVQKPKDSLALDPSITYGKFDNGFQYYIKPTSKAPKSLEIRFLVKAGFNQEDEDQYTLAHFMEHIALKAGKNVSTRLLYGTKLANNLNISRGAVTAYTARQYTEYVMRIPVTNKAKKFAFQLIRDIMQGLEFKDNYIESERSPFMDESEVRGGANSITTKKFLLDSKVIGCGANAPKDYQSYIQNFSKDKLIRFYKDWYRPELMGVIITGGVKEPKSLTKELKRWFASVPNPKRSRTREDCTKMYMENGKHFYKQERELTYSDQYGVYLHYQLYFTAKSLKENNSKSGLEDQLKEEVILKILQERLKWLQELENWPFQVTADLSDQFSYLKIQIITPDDISKKSISRAMSVIHQFKKYGVLSEELASIKHKLKLSLLSTTTTSYWNSEIRKHFLNQEALPANKNRLLIKYLEQLTKNEINTYFQKNYAATPNDIGLIAPYAHPLLKNKEDTVRSWIMEGLEQKVTHFKIPSVPTKLLDSSLVKGFVEGEYKELEVKINGAKKYQLANGLQLVFKPLTINDSMQIQKGEIRFLGINPKGAFCFPEHDYFSAINAPQIINSAGVANMDPFLLKRYLKSKNPFLYAMPYIHNQESGIQGRATMNTLETALQLIYLYFTVPNKNKAAFERWKNEAPLENLKDVNQKDFRTNIELALGHLDYLPTGTLRMQGVTKTDVDRAYSIYQNLFAKASDFTFLFSGDFEVEKALKLCNKYLGNLPNKQDSVCRTSAKKAELFYGHKLAETWESPDAMNNTLVNLYYRTKTTPENLNWREEVKLKLMANLMDVILMKKLRLESEEGGPYSIRAIYHPDLDNFFHELIIIYSCQPEDQKRLALEIKNSIKEIQQEFFNKNMFETVKKEFLTLQRENNYNRLQKIATHLRQDQPWYSQNELIAYIKSLNPEDIAVMANDYLEKSPCEFMMIPNQDSTYPTKI